MRGDLRFLAVFTHFAPILNILFEVWPHELARYGFNRRSRACVRQAVYQLENFSPSVWRNQWSTRPRGHVTQHHSLPELVEPTRCQRDGELGYPEPRLGLGPTHDIQCLSSLFQYSNTNDM